MALDADLAQHLSEQRIGGDHLVRAGEQRFQPGDLLAVDRFQIRLRGDDQRRRLGEPGDLGPQGLHLRLAGLEAREQSVARFLAFQAVEQAFNGTFCLGDPGFQLRLVATILLTLCLHQPLDLGRELRREGRGHQAAAQAVQHSRFQLLARDRPAVGAFLFALGLAAIAAVAILGDNGEPATAAAAFDQSVQQIARPVAAVQRASLTAILLMRPLQPILDRVPHIIGDDRQIRRFAIDDVVGICGAGDPQPGLAIPVKPVATVNDHADIGFVAQHPVALPGVAPDRAVIPFAPGRGGDAVCVQPRGDRARRNAVRVIVKDAPNHRRMFGHDLTVQPALAGRDLITIGQPGGDPTFPRQTLLAAPHLVADLARLVFGDRAEKRHQLPVKAAAV